MSRRALRELRRLKLLGRRWQPADLGRFSDDELRRRLGEYYEARTEASRSEFRVYQAEHVPLSSLISSVSARSDIEAILPALLVFGRIFIRDHLMVYSQPDSAHTKASRQALGGPASKLLDRKKLTECLQFLSNMGEFITDESVVCAPLHLLHSRGESIPIFYSEDNYRSVFPSDLYDLIHENVEVRRMMIEEGTGGFLVERGLASSPSRAISVSFRDDAANAGMCFVLSTTESMDPMDGEGNFRVKYKYDLEAPVDQPIYDSWKEQSINRTAINRLESIGKEMALCESLGASYLTESPFESKLLGLAGEDSSQSTAADAVNLLRANAPTLSIEDPATVLRIRRRHRKALKAMRTALNDAALELKGLSDSEFERRAQAVMRRLVEPQLKRVESRLLRYVASGTGMAVSTAASISLAVLSGGSLPLGAVVGLTAAGAAASSLPSIASYLSERKRPEHILWRFHKEHRD